MLERQPKSVVPPRLETRQDPPSPLISDILSTSRFIWPERIAIKFGDKNVAYEKLFEDATKIAHGLLDLGIAKGDRIAVLSGNSPEYIKTCFAAALIGAQLTPLNFRSTPEQITHMLKTSEAKMICYADRNRQSVNEIKKTINPSTKLVAFETREDGEIPFSQLIAHSKGEEIDTSGIKDKDIAVVMFTSGTTSLPKAVEQPHASFTASLAISEDPEKHETILVTTPLFHVAALQGVFASVAEGRTMVLLPDFKPESLLQALSSGVQRATLVPTQIEQIISSPHFSEYDLSKVRQITYGGSQMPLSVILEAMKKLPNTGFVRAYGLTETGGTVAVMGQEDHKITGQESPDELAKKHYKLTYGIGKPVEGVKITVVNDDGHEIPPREEEGVLGRITIETNRVMQGYIGQEKATKEVLEGNRFTTQDLGWVDKQGNIYLVGRADDMIVRGGEKIPPAEIETVIAKCSGIAEVGVVGIPDEQWGQCVAAVVTLKPGAETTEKDIITYCKNILGSSKMPTKVIIVEELPRNALGKLVRKELNQLLVAPDK